MEQQVELYKLIDQFCDAFKIYRDGDIEALRAEVAELRATIAAMLETFERKSE